MRSLKTGRYLATKYILAILSFLFVKEIGATVITVTSTGDTIAVDGFVTLREALTASNTDAMSGDAVAGSGVDTIEFNIPGVVGSIYTIQPSSALPAITDSVIINGYTQPGATENTLVSGNNAFIAIEIDGTNAGASAGLQIDAGNSTIQGLVINRFANEGILITSLGSNLIRGNFIGTDSTGMLDNGNLSDGIAIQSSNNVIGGSTPGDKNLVSGNDGNGINISGNVTGNRILGNIIGVAANGVASLPNSSSGIYISDANTTTIGGLLANNANLIAFNGQTGILIDSSAGTGNLILGNSIHSNSLLGIDLDNDGVSLNDSLDSDTGPNNLQNFAVLSSATTNEHGLIVKGTLSSTPSSAYRVEFFANTVADASGYGEGQNYIGFIDVTTDALGEASFVFQSSTNQMVGTLISSTVTDPNNNTSEFSASISVSYLASIEDDDDYGDDDAIFSDDDYGIFPFPFAPPFAPVPPVPAATGAQLTEEESVAVVKEPNASLKQTKADKSDVSSLENAPAIENSHIDIRPKPRRQQRNTEGSGCSTVNGTDSTLSLFFVLAFAWLGIRKRRKA
ncbi:MAG: right-handed parallel beta-helix repeat-containing protein [Myxococcales bacterium]|nr:right-handed parallel beta-helix repeat-containing protein [Myxococcales bacterium]USN49776.1 MAG: right-handed parallel beta-helix repeat-containing protein [Myxococcales bacterium]